MQLLDGKALSLEIHEQIATDIAKRRGAGRKIPCLAAVLVGNDGGSETYVASKIKTCEKVGMLSRLYRFDNNVTESELLELIERLNHDGEVTGVLVQLPLPKHVDDAKVVNAVTPRKDVDGFHPLNAGRMLKGLPSHLPATPKGIMLLLERYNVETEGKHCVVIGRSDIVGRPMSVLMGRAAYPGNCTVTLT
ncbi:MAG TPA: tetrahydrofolate dehydrogenase/cyclohydrolase catalytic domain-containing protein, partial [Chitinophagales bacterium]|nr:tetrahydrofolate dehydrogenase/cyclohydrolase catalytic domain-containing protein [Chitinophagales bacterium]